MDEADWQPCVCHGLDDEGPTGCGDAGFKRFLSYGSTDGGGYGDGFGWGDSDDHEEDMDLFRAENIRQVETWTVGVIAAPTEEFEAVIFTLAVMEGVQRG